MLIRSSLMSRESIASTFIGNREGRDYRPSRTPNRETHPKELLDLGIREFREAFFKPYRIVYQVAEREVHVLLITDGRRDLRTLLQRRLLASWP